MLPQDSPRSKTHGKGIQCWKFQKAIFFLSMSPGGKGSKSKTKQMGLYQPKKILHSEGNHQQNETAAY